MKQNYLRFSRCQWETFAPLLKVDQYVSLFADSADWGFSVYSVRKHLKFPEYYRQIELPLTSISFSSY